MKTLYKNISKSNGAITCLAVDSNAKTYSQDYYMNMFVGEQKITSIKEINRLKKYYSNVLGFHKVGAL